MNNERKRTIEELAERLDQESDAMLIIASRKGQSNIIMKGDNVELMAALATAMAKYPNVRQIMFNSLGTASHVSQKALTLN